MMHSFQLGIQDLQFDVDFWYSQASHVTNENKLVNKFNTVYILNYSKAYRKGLKF